MTPLKLDNNHTWLSANGANINHHIYQNLSAKDLANPQSVVKAFKEAEVKELQVNHHCAVHDTLLLVYKGMALFLNP